MTTSPGVRTWLGLVLVTALVSGLPACGQATAPSRPSRDDGAAGTPADAARPADAGAPADATTSTELALVDAALDPVGQLARDWPLTWTTRRQALMLAYRRTHSDPAATDLRIEPRMIVLHYTAGGSAAATKRYFDRDELEQARATLRGGGAANVSAHFLVDRDGTIFRLLPETTMARHCIGLNHVAIGVENVGDDRRWPLTAAQVQANARLVRALTARFPITHLIGHHEARGFEGSPWFVERVRGYRNRKPDPGAAFMAKVRAEVVDLGLSAAP